MKASKSRNPPHDNGYCRAFFNSIQAFHMLQRTAAFADLGTDYLDRVDKHRTAKRLVHHLNALGYAVMLRPKPAN